MKIVVLDAATLGLPDSAWEVFRTLGELVLHPLTPPGAASIVARAAGAEVICTNKVQCTEAVISQLPGLQQICVLATGYNNIEIDAARRRGVAVCNVPAYSTESVAQHTWALILAHFNRVERHDATVQAGDWTRSPTFAYWLQPLVGLSEKTLGIVGFGTIGRRVAEIGHAFGMRVLASSRSRRDPPNWPSFAWAEVDEICRVSDVITLHCPATPETVGMIDAARLATMKPGVLLVNTARGSLIDETALATALRAGRLGGAALDVLSVEPPPADHPLLRAPGCLITPHLAWAGQESRNRLLEETFANVQAGLTGHYRNRVA